MNDKKVGEINFFKKYKFPIMIAIGILFVTLLTLFIPYLFLNNKIKEFYSTNEESMFVSNYEIVKQENFSPEIRILNWGLQEVKMTAFYSGQNYRNYSQVSIADFFYIERSGLFSWDIISYESSFLPYIENEELSFEDSYNAMKNNVLSGDVKKGLTPDQEYDLLQQLNKNNAKEGELVDFIQSNDESITIEILAGESFGSNYALINNDTKIENIRTGTISLDNKYLIYTTGEYFEPLGELVPYLDIWVYNLDTNSNKKIYVINDENKPNDFNLFSSRDKIYVSTKNNIFSIDLNGDNKQIITTFEEKPTGNEEFDLPEVVEINEDNILYLLPNNEEFRVNL